jgi:hypothetical protein
MVIGGWILLVLAVLAAFAANPFLGLALLVLLVAVWKPSWKS